MYLIHRCFLFEGDGYVDGINYAVKVKQIGDVLHSINRVNYRKPQKLGNIDKDPQNCIESGGFLYKG
jgi:hypothetical protein